jgi:hypothetical protein
MEINRGQLDLPEEAVAPAAPKPVAAGNRSGTGRARTPALSA